MSPVRANVHAGIRKCNWSLLICTSELKNVIGIVSNENIETKWGKINCMVFMPKMQKGRIFQHEEKMKLWITDDKNHLLFKVEAEIWAGTIKAELNNFRGLKYPIRRKKKDK